MTSGVIVDYCLRKKHHYCVTCGAQDAYTLIGRIQCFECSKKTNESHRNSYSKNNSNEKKKKLRTERKSQGLCIECGEKAADGRIRCHKHLMSARISQERHRERKGIIPKSLKIQLGYCANCLDFATHGKLCEKCYEKAMRGIDKATQIIREKHEYERKTRENNA